MYTFYKAHFLELFTLFASSLDPDQDRQNVGLDLDPNRLTARPHSVSSRESYCWSRGYECIPAQLHKRMAGDSYAQCGIADDWDVNP